MRTQKWISYADSLRFVSQRVNQIKGNRFRPCHFGKELEKMAKRELVFVGVHCFTHCSLSWQPVPSRSCPNTPENLDPS